MPWLRIECLCCGDVRVLHPDSHHRVDGGECTRCSYVGWAATHELNEVLRGRLRRRSLERRRLRVA